jgi:hypothetical protein
MLLKHLAVLPHFFVCVDLVLKNLPLGIVDFALLILSHACCPRPKFLLASLPSSVLGFSEDALLITAATQVYDVLRLGLCLADLLSGLLLLSTQ